ncbi:hypothetical protein [Fontivita pretiosa]|uniref:hypothetical protein n=1 Tax=Fontivita pretiosa TaxID=2989684 RepID=UPI003D17E242
MRTCWWLILAVLLVLWTISHAMAQAAEEPSVALASTWWAELRNVVTPIAWRDHPHRFCVVYDGTIIGLPQPQKLLRHPWDTGQPLEGVQLGFYPSPDGTLPRQPTEQHQLALPNGNRVGDQGWHECAAPVLWTRWRHDTGTPAGITLRQSAFAHMSGGAEARTGEEPVFAWIRLEVVERAAQATADECNVFVKVASPHMRFDMSRDQTCRVMPALSTYPGRLRLDPGGQEHRPGAFLVEDDRKVRLVVLPGGDARSIRHLPPSDKQRDHFLQIILPATAGAQVDLLVPMVPSDRAAIADELAIGYDGALQQTEAFWSARPATAALVHTPEPLINAAIQHSVRLARMISTTVPQTRQRSLLTGAMHYSYLWVTPTCMTKQMLLDPLGWHDDVDRYLEIYRQEQGRRRPPGPEFQPHPGHFGTPDVLDSGNHWMTDHGAVLHTAARHALLTADQQFIRRWQDPILKACDFIKQARRLPRAAPGAPGVLPPAEATDISRPMQAVWSDGWNYKALATAARLLRVLQHPRAEEFERECDEYRQAIIAALRAKAARQPRWTDASGRARSIVPMTLSTDDADGLGHEHPFYLDTGPMMLVWAGVLRADDPLMRDAVEFFRQGPHTREAVIGELDWNVKPRLVHEVSSGLPCASWNAFHSHQLGDRQRYLECMYSLFTGAISRQTFVSCETIGGITENVFSATLAVELARLAVVDDEVEPGTLHLLRLVPLAWCSATEQTRFENMPTEFGPVTLKWQLADGGRTLQVQYAPSFRRAPQAVLLHAPPVKGLEKIVINGREHRAQQGASIRL